MPVVLPSASSGQRRRPEWSDLAAQYRAHACPCRTLRRRRCRRRCMTRGRRGSLRLRRLALSSFPFCRFIPAHPDLLTYPSAELSGSRGATAGRMRSRGLGKRSAGAPVSESCTLGRPATRTTRCPSCVLTSIAHRSRSHRRAWTRGNSSRHAGAARAPAGDRRPRETDRVGSWPARGRCPCPRQGARIIQELWSLEQPDG
jgi:hypothetical protein